MTLGPSQESLKQKMTRNQTLQQRSQVAKMQSEILEQARIQGISRIEARIQGISRIEARISNESERNPKYAW